MHCRRSYSVLFAVIASTPFSLAQDPQRSPDLAAEAPDTTYRRNTASILFDKNLSTYNWIGRAIVDTSFSGTRVSLREEYLSNIILLEGTPGQDRRLQSNQQRLSLHVSQPVDSVIAMRARWESRQYTDNKAVGLSRASTQSLLGGLEYSPVQSISLTPMIGHRWDSQLGTADRGLQYLIGATTGNVDFDGYHVSGQAQFHEARLDPRTLESHFARAAVHKTFLGATRDSLEAGFLRNRREFYALADTAIESRGENILTFTNLLNYELQRNLLTTLFVNINSRMLDKDIRTLSAKTQPPSQFNTQIEEFRLDAYLQAGYQSDDGRTATSARFYYSERSENHSAKPSEGASADALRLRNLAEQTKDNVSRRTSLSGSIELPLSQSDRISFSGVASILRYDTPSDQNVEDRDELLVALTLSTSHQMSRYFDVMFTLDGNLSHTVYLLADRSLSNNINRVIKFAPRTTYRPWDGAATMNAFEVLANYTVYDFEVLQVRSFSYRQFGWVDSTSVQLTPRLGLDFLSYLKLYERGQLNWNAFTESVENSFIDRTFALQFRFVPYGGTLFALGIRYFDQSRYGYSRGTKELEASFRSVGPTCVILWEIGAHSTLEFRGWYEHRRQSGGAVRSLANMTMNFLLNF